MDSLFALNESFMPHGHCYLWRPDILWTHVAADVIIALAYIMIPIAIAYLFYRQRQSANLSVALLFAAFIVLCGLTHLFNIYVIWYPAYEVQSYIKGLTAIVSMVSAIVVVSKTPYFLELFTASQKTPSTEPVTPVNSASEQAILQREQQVVKLKSEVNALLAELNRDSKYSGHL